LRGLKVAVGVRKVAVGVRKVAVGVRKVAVGVRKVAYRKISCFSIKVAYHYRYYF